MHLYMMTRGIKHDVDRFINELQGKYLPFKWRANKDEPFQDRLIQFAVRPIQLWEMVFPHEHKDLICTSFFEERMGEPQHQRHKKFVTLMRKVLGVDKLEYTPIKNPDGSFAKIPYYCKNVELVGIGTKEDIIKEDGVERL